MSQFTVWEVGLILYKTRKIPCDLKCIFFPPVCVCVCVHAHTCTFSVTSDSLQPWTVACQTPLSMEFSKQEYWSGLPFLSPGDLPNPGIEPTSPALQADSLLTEPSGKPAQAFATFWYSEKQRKKYWDQQQGKDNSPIRLIQFKYCGLPIRNHGGQK